ncbi:hypothetical protein BD779DRAFT_415051 [Infundibulicybe gibba]|nr:hypothetical protein BD779DRAFT_415051 [Infundibulicybe gibba]
MDAVMDQVNPPGKENLSMLLESLKGDLCKWKSVRRPALVDSVGITLPQDHETAPEVEREGILSKLKPTTYETIDRTTPEKTNELASETVTLLVMGSDTIASFLVDPRPHDNPPSHVPQIPGHSRRVG